ncbi:amino acid permease/ SLC12A domain-containing protein [Whalleya microplaca]|nr:amino acid permease/ SLC12A domain-containing protein [Whalleya microplaca]
MAGYLTNSNASLKKVISTRQFVIMALGSSVGAGLLVASYQGLAVGGPGGLLSAFALAGCAVWATMGALAELSAALPVKGSFFEYAVHLLSPAWGFAVGWNYVLNFVLMVTFELVIVLLCAQYWDPGLPIWYVVPPCIVCLAVIYAFGGKWYAESENVFGVLKMGVVLVFVLASLCILSRAVPSDHRPSQELGFNLWTGTNGDGGAFKNGPTGFLYVFMSAGMAYGGTEMLGFAATECKSNISTASLIPVYIGLESDILTYSVV